MNAPYLAIRFHVSANRKQRTILFILITMIFTKYATKTLYIYNCQEVSDAYIIYYAKYLRLPQFTGKYSDLTQLINQYHAWCFQ